MPEESLIRALLLPELTLVSLRRVPDSRVVEVLARKVPREEYCPRCATKSTSGYRSFVRRFFPNARIVADKFHVLRLLSPAINRHRKAITGDKRTNPSSPGVRLCAHHCWNRRQESETCASVTERARCLLSPSG